MKLTIGDIVCYKLSAFDAEAITVSRQKRAEREGADAYVSRFGNRAEAGQVFPAQVVRIFDPTGEFGTANLQVSLDGDDRYWATSRKIGDAEGHWCWDFETE